MDDTQALEEVDFCDCCEGLEYCMFCV